MFDIDIAMSGDRCVDIEDCGCVDDVGHYYTVGIFHWGYRRLVR